MLRHPKCDVEKHPPLAATDVRKIPGRDTHGLDKAFCWLRMAKFGWKAHWSKNKYNPRRDGVLAGNVSVSNQRVVKSIRSTLIGKIGKMVTIPRCHKNTTYIA